MRFVGLLLLVAGCASVATPTHYADRQTIVPPDQAARIARQVFDARRIPLRRTSDRRNVETGYFDAADVWSRGEIDAVVECGEPKRGREPGGSITMSISMFARERVIENVQHRLSAGMARGVITVVSVRSAGQRTDGAKCRLTEEYTVSLLDAIAGFGGSPSTAAGNEVP